MSNNFLWIGINNNGEKISGKMEALTVKSATDQLKQKNIILLSIKKCQSSFSIFKTKKFTHKHRLDFTQQLQLLLQAGIPLVDSLTLIANTSAHTVAQSFLYSLKEKIISGVNFSDALSNFPLYFDQSFCQMIKAGEQSGQLDIVLTQLIDNQEQHTQLTSKISKALFYPMSVMGIAILISIGLLIFVIPQFKTIYDNFGAKLPIMTQCLISMSHYIIHHGIFYLILMVFISFLIKKISHKNNRMKSVLHKLLFKIPFVQSLIVTRQVTQWAQLLSMTLSSGIPLIDALFIANQAISYEILQTQMQEVRQSVIMGQSLQAALTLCPYFPLRAKSMISIGENADALAFMMKKIAAIYQHKLNESLDRLSKLLEPVIMITVASMVSGLIIAMYLPIFKMGSVI